MPEIKRGNPKALETIALKIKQLEGIQGKVGWFGSAGTYENGFPVAANAALQELGHGPIPPRPTMRPTAVKQRAAWAQNAAEGSKAVIAGRATPVQLMAALTTQAEGDIRQAILDLTQPPLSPITIELRAMKKRDPNLRVTGRTVGEAAARVNAPGYQTPDVSTKPLIDSTKLITELTHVVESV